MYEHNKDHHVEVSGFVIFLNDLHHKLIHYMQNGELTYGETDSSWLDRSGHSWARATFSKGALSELIFV